MGSMASSPALFRVALALGALLFLVSFARLRGVPTKPTSTTRSADSRPCLFRSPTVFQDMHDGDRKVVTEAGDTLLIKPFDTTQNWEVRSVLDKTHCNATVDFRVKGKPSPPPRGNLGLEPSDNRRQGSEGHNRVHRPFVD